MWKVNLYSGKTIIGMVLLCRAFLPLMHKANEETKIGIQAKPIV
jgi:hypothetical protein